jgi:hypothetical protein
MKRHPIFFTILIIVIVITAIATLYFLFTFNPFSIIIASVGFITFCLMVERIPAT